MSESLADRVARSVPEEIERPEVYRYHLLRAALDAGLPSLAALDERHLSRVGARADKSFELESLVLGTPEAAKVQLPPARIDEAIAELRGRYPDEAAFGADLAVNGLDEVVLARALERELVFDAVMQQVAARRASLTEIDERLFYELHKAEFTTPERRTARHILITVNDAFEENRRQVARERIERLAERLGGRPNHFPSLARQHSECPTAMENGRLGTLPRGKLYPELDAALFALPEGAVSAPVESEIGFHLLWCEKIHRGCTLPFSRVRARIRQVLEERARRSCQKAFIAALKGNRTGHPSREGEARA
jgi:peptidyl-prolyl cis-trans isomerase C